MPRSPPQLAGLFAVGLGTLIAPLDTAVNIAFPGITQAFALPIADIRWVVVAYVLTYASLMLVCGGLGDILGYRVIFQIGLLLSAAGLGACALASTYALLLVGRMLQGVGIALALSCGPALAISLYGESGRTRALAFYAGITAAGSALGPLIGGIVVARWGWPGVFWFRVPLALLALLSSGLVRVEPSQSPKPTFDSAGAGLLVAWMSTLLLAVTMLPDARGPAMSIGLTILALLCFAAFVVHEARSPQPLIRLSLFADAGFSLLNAASIAVHLTAFGVLILIPYFLVRVAGLDVATAGAVLALAALGTVAGSWLAGRLARRVSVGRLALAGVVLNIAGLWAISLWTPESGFTTIGLALVIQGLGVGLFQVSYADYVLASLPSSERGVAGSLVTVTRTIGVVLGATVLSAAFSHLEEVARRAGSGPADAFLAGFQATFRQVALGLALSLGLTLLRPRVWRIGAP